ncbi:zinc finger MYM-type 1-like [Pelobates cultripes]|uniref:Zinc finger MYM-type 1-like n=1 Tax=Pelobates cultripes TaxID=61616 RepID=A0AAD1WN52_PELCU|nr:zinc finger MYM-type 1-like [Pelobates cultripes]
MSAPRKKLSGAAFRKKRRLQEEDTSKMAGSLNRFFKPDPVLKAVSETKENREAVDVEPHSSTSTTTVGEHSLGIESDTNTEEESSPKSSSSSSSEDENAKSTLADLFDPADWPEMLTSSLKETIVLKGPAKPKEHFAFPKDASKRRFTSTHYRRRLGNGEVHVRKWLSYSPRLDKIFCFCCKLFTTTKMSLTTGGYNDWKNLSQCLATHEVSPSHLTAMGNWTELLTRLGSGTTIDHSYQRLLATETQHWQNVLQRLVAIVQYLGKQCLAFRGSSDTLYSENNGNYLKLVEMMATFDSVMQSHLKKIQNSEIHQHYLGKDIQNELIGLISKEIRRRILRLLKDAKYYSIILDCTPDITLVEQMTMVFRFVSVKQGDSPTANPEIHIEERFLGFLPVHNSSGEGLTEAILNELEMLKIPLSDMRGQGYDNGSNMKGKHSGVQKRIMDLNSRAFYVPCSAHSLNLVVNDAAMCCRDASTFFGILQKIYVFLSGSTNRWDVLKKHVSKLTVKPLSDTRWSSRIDAIRPFRFHVGEVYDTLIEIGGDMNFAALARIEASSLAKELNKFKFLCLIILWFNILSRINSVSKVLQSQSIYLPDVVELLESIKTIFQSYRTDDGFEDLLKEAGELAVEMEIDPVFPPQVHQTRKKKVVFV